MLTHLFAMDNQGCIGKANTIPWRCKADMQHFKAYTTGKILIMGRKTFDSINPPLKNRIVIVVSSSQDVIDAMTDIPSHYGAGTLEVALKMAEHFNHSMGIEETVIVGGGSIYKQTAHLVDKAIISVIDTVVDEGDTFVDWEYKHITPVKLHFATN